MSREAFCTAVDCRATSGRVERQEELDAWCLAHTDRHPGHDYFRRVTTDHLLIGEAWRDEGGPR
ncbi:hypothetical protein [Streptomyces sp. NPDC057702]|uniref:DUF7848 domain-containing protein n=1 Tax=unclassified Streptomyces TaxID=2593676 RepID=UPI00368AABA4